MGPHDRPPRSGIAGGNTVINPRPHAIGGHDRRRLLCEAAQRRGGHEAARRTREKCPPIH
jgi:hypothetical protein